MLIIAHKNITVVRNEHGSLRNENELLRSKCAALLNTVKQGYAVLQHYSSILWKNDLLPDSSFESGYSAQNTMYIMNRSLIINGLSETPVRQTYRTSLARLTSSQKLKQYEDQTPKPPPSQDRGISAQGRLEGRPDRNVQAGPRPLIGVPSRF